jgi:hypothetical protein
MRAGRHVYRRAVDPTVPQMMPARDPLRSALEIPPLRLPPVD